MALSGSSTTPGSRTAPEALASADPPETPRDASAIRANVSALLSSTCERLRATPLRIDGGRPRSAGRAGPPVIARITAVASPATNDAGPIDSSIGTPSWRSASAIAREVARSGRSALIRTMIRGAPRARAAVTAPSRTRCGTWPSRTPSLPLAVSPSAPLTITCETREPTSDASLRSVGKAAPPAPTTSLAATRAMSSSMAGLGAAPQRRRCSTRLTGRPGSTPARSSVPGASSSRGSRPGRRPGRASPGRPGACREPAPGRDQAPGRGGLAGQGLGHRTTPAPTSSDEPRPPSGDEPGPGPTGRTGRRPVLTIARVRMTAPSVPTSSPCPTASAHTG